MATAPGGAEALTRLEAGEPVDLVILDLNMPGMNGAETLKRIREVRPGLPVILATGFLDGATVELLRRDGRALSIFKPYTMAELDLKLRELES